MELHLSLVIVLIALCISVKSDPVSIFEQKCDEYYSKTENVDTEFPFMVSLGFGEKGKEKWSCGGSLISEKHVLTAAQCVNSEAIGEVKWVRFGTTNFKTANHSQIQQYAVATRIPHPDYKSRKAYNDIALLVLEENVVFNNHVRPICLEAINDLSDSIPIATGWGKPKTGSTPSDELKRVELNLVKIDKCKIKYDRPIALIPEGILDESQICLAARVEGLDTCTGDSGGPVQVKHSKHEKAYTQVGITSFGAHCGDVEFPGVYTRVSHYLPWIQQHVK